MTYGLKISDRKCPNTFTYAKLKSNKALTAHWSGVVIMTNQATEGSREGTEKKGV